MCMKFNFALSICVYIRSLTITFHLLIKKIFSQQNVEFYFIQHNYIFFEQYFRVFNTLNSHIFEFLFLLLYIQK